MQIQIELTRRVAGVADPPLQGERVVARGSRPPQQNELAGVTLYSFECDLLEATELLEMTRDHCPPAVKDIEHAIFAATAGSFRGNGSRRHQPDSADRYDSLTPRSALLENYHTTNLQRVIDQASSRNSPKLSNTGRSVTEKMIAGSFLDVFWN